jgi:signal transduction histidine kinase
MCWPKNISWLAAYLALCDAVFAANTSALGPRKVVSSYALTSANDFQQRDPQDWRLLGSNDGGKTWATLDKRAGEIFSERHQRRVFSLADPKAFNLYRLQIDRVRNPASANCVQLAEIEPMGASPADISPTPIYLDTITAQGDNPPLESVDRAFDGLAETKWLDRPENKTTCASWIQWQYAAPSSVVITNIARLRELRSRADTGYPVRLEAVFGGKIAGSGSVELLDDSGFLEMDGPSELFQLVPGQGILVEGLTTWHSGLVGVGQGRVQVRTPPAAASPIHLSLEQPLAEEADFLWAQVEGRIQFKHQIGGQVSFRLERGIQSMSVSMSDLGAARTLPSPGRHVRVTGICRGGYNDQGTWVAASLRATGFEELTTAGDFTEGNEAASSQSLPGTAEAFSVPAANSQTSRARAAGVTQIAQLRQMSLDEWRRATTVTIRGVVTSLLGVFLQDDTAGIQVVVRPADSGKLVELGEYVEVTGQMSVSDAATRFISADKVVFLGRGRLPRPQQPPWSQLANGQMDSVWVQLEGVVRATDGAHLLLNCDGRQVTASLASAANPVVNRLVDASVRMNGVAVAALDDLGRMRGVHLLIPSLEFLQTEREPAEPFSQPRMPIQSLLRVGGAGAFPHRVRVEGVLTLVDGQRLFLQDDTGAAMAIFKQEALLDSQFGSSRWSFWRTPSTPSAGAKSLPFSPGDRVEVVGFQDAHGYSPVLTEVLARKTGGPGKVELQQITTNSFSDWRLDSCLVKLTGVLLGQQLLGEQRVLELRSQGRTLQAFLPVDARAGESLQPGATLQVSGIWQMDPVPYAELGRRVGAVRILTRSPADVVVLARPSWWTVQRALALVSGLSFVLVAAFIWISQLRRKVEERSAQLSKEIHLREQTERQRALEEERTRIARDLHDDLGAALTQIRFLSAVESRDQAVPEETRAQLRQVSDKSNQLVTSLDEIVWAINPANDSVPNLAQYLCHVAEEFFRPTPVRCRMEVDESLPTIALTSEVRHNLYLAVREAMNNIAKHSQATEVWLRIQKHDHNLAIVVEDNGRGFAETARAEAGEGLRNMRQRVAKAGGRFEHESRPGQGTSCRIMLPLDQATL